MNETLKKSEMRVMWIMAAMIRNRSGVTMAAAVNAMVRNTTDGWASR